MRQALKGKKNQADILKQKLLSNNRKNNSSQQKVKKEIQLFLSISRNVYIHQEILLQLYLSFLFLCIN